MTDRDALEEAREMLAGIAELRPPWELDTKNFRPGLGYPVWADDGDLIVYASPPGGHGLGDAGEFIAASPDLVARLADALAEARAEVGRLRQAADDAVHLYHAALEERDEALAAIARVEALADRLAADDGTASIVAHAFATEIRLALSDGDPR